MSRVSRYFLILTVVSVVTSILFVFFTETFRRNDHQPRRLAESSEPSKIQSAIRREDKSPSYSRTTKAKNRDFVVSENGQLFIVGGAWINSTKQSVWDKINVYGQRLGGGQTLQCCLKYSDGEISQLPTEKEQWFYTTGTVPLPLFNIICANPRYKERGGLDGQPMGVSVIYTGSTCESPAAGYVEPYYPLRQADGTFAVTTKISHGNLSPDLVITWMEAYRWLGVDKVITYALNNLSSDARMVLEYYARKNVLDLYEYQIPGLELFPRSLPVQWVQTLTDSAPPMFDAFARSSGYTYFAVIDWDEFIIPSGNRTLKQLLADLFAKHERAAGFKFKSQYFITSAPPEESDLFLKKFVHRLKRQAMLDRPKIMFKADTARIITSHGIEPFPGYRLLDCEPSEAHIRHFRSCLPNDKGRVRTCAKAAELDLVRDTKTAEWAENIAERVRRVKEQIFPVTR